MRPRGFVNHFGGPSRGRRGGRGRDPFFVVFAIQLLQRINDLPYKPPVTLFLMAFMSLLHFGFLPNFPQLCLMPAELLGGILNSRETAMNLILHSFVHADEWHLYYNMSSLLWKGVHLEKRMGSQPFAKLIAGFTIATSVIFVVLSGITGMSYGTCTVGFSQVLFALKTVLNLSSGYDRASVFGIPVPSKWAAWLELVLVYVLFPGTSFLGHFSGIIAGLAYLALSGNAKDVLFFFSEFRLPSFLRPRANRRSNNWGSGTASRDNPIVDEID